MNEEAEFLRQLAANPNDLTLRGVYADWLADNGRPAFAEAVRGNQSAPYPNWNKGSYSNTGPLHESYHDRVHYRHGNVNSQLTTFVVPPHNPQSWITLTSSHPESEMGPMLRRMRDEGVNLRGSFADDEEHLQRHLSHVEPEPPERMSRRRSVKRKYGRVPADELLGHFQQGGAGGTYDPQNVSDGVFADKLEDADDPRAVYVRRDLSYRGPGIGYAVNVAADHDRLGGADSEPLHGHDVSHELDDGTRLLTTPYVTDGRVTSYYHEWRHPGSGHAYGAVLAPAEHAEMMRRLGLTPAEPEAPTQHARRKRPPVESPRAGAFASPDVLARYGRRCVAAVAGLKSSLEGTKYERRANNVRRYGRAPADEVRGITAGHNEHGGGYDPDNQSDMILADKLADHDDPLETVVRRDLSYRRVRGDYGAYSKALTYHTNELGGAGSPLDFRNDHLYAMPEKRGSLQVARYGDDGKGNALAYQVLWTLPRASAMYLGAMTPEETIHLLDEHGVQHNLQLPYQRPTTPPPAQMSRRGSVRRYAATEGDVNNLLAQLQQPEHNEHRWGLDDPLSGLRGVAADALDEQGRSDEAKALRTPNQRVFVHDGLKRVFREYVLPHRHRDTALGWHGGGGSPLYGIGSTGLVNGYSARRSLEELDDVRNTPTADTGLDHADERVPFDALYDHLSRIERETADEGHNDEPAQMSRGLLQRRRYAASTKKDVGEELRETAFRLNDELEVGPDYQRLFWNPKTKVAWYVTADGDEESEVKKIRNALENVSGVEHVRVEAEYFPPDDDSGWVEMYDRNNPDEGWMPWPPKERKSRRRYAAYRAPAGGMVVRGTQYTGGEMVPDMTGAFANPPVRKQEGDGGGDDGTSATDINTLPPAPAEQRDYGQPQKRIDVMRRIAARRKRRKS